MLKFTIYSSLTAPITHHILTSMSNTVDQIRVKKYFSQLVLVDKLSRLDGQSCRVENASHLFTKAKIRHKPREGHIYPLLKGFY